MAPSALPFGLGWHLPRAMTEDDMARVRRAVHRGGAARGAHRLRRRRTPYGPRLYAARLLLPIAANTRNDAWGGSLDGRMRFPLEVARAVRAVVPRGTPLGARLTGSDWTEGGLTVADAVALAKALKAAGLDYVDVSSGGVTTSATPPSTPGHNVPLAEAVRRDARHRDAHGRADRHAGPGRGHRRGGPRRHGRARPRLSRRSALGLARRAGVGGEVTHPPQYLRAGPVLARRDHGASADRDQVRWPTRFWSTLTPRSTGREPPPRRGRGRRCRRRRRLLRRRRGPAGVSALGHQGAAGAAACRIRRRRPLPLPMKSSRSPAPRIAANRPMSKASPACWRKPGSTQRRCAAARIGRCRSRPLSPWRGPARPRPCTTTAPASMPAFSVSPAPWMPTAAAIGSPSIRCSARFTPCWKI